MNRKTIAGLCLGLFVFGFIFEYILSEHRGFEHESVKTQVTYFYNLNPISVSGTASTTPGPITFIKV